MISSIQSILIANRGEIASRIIRTCKQLGIRSVAVYAEPDKDLPFVAEADSAIALGGLQAKQSYLVFDKILEAARLAQVDAIHPGFGFLSENADFARACAKAGFIFIGPNPEAIEVMGIKSVAKARMKAQGVPTVPGYEGDAQSVDALMKEAEQVGYPILIKAVAGGGGKGMRIARHKEELEAAIKAAKQEAQNSFGNDEVLLERYFNKVRHIEFQIFGDQQGNIIHLLERECSLQRRYQKVVEESPSSVLTEELRAAMGQAAVAAGQAINYDNAGTVEFILTDQNEFFFLEINTRLQVEHPVTEMITGLDLVAWQIQVAEGTALPLKQNEVTASGYAVECRLYAEDPMNQFFPATGKVLQWKAPELEGLRIETGVQTGSEVSIYFDPMLAKLVAHAPTRQQGLRKMAYALQQLCCLGLTTNQSFLQNLLQLKEVQAGAYNTHFIQQDFDFEALRQQQSAGSKLAAIACLLYRWQARNAARTLIPSLAAGWRSNFYQAQQETYHYQEEALALQYEHLGQQQFKIQLGEENHLVELVQVEEGSVRFVLDQQQELYYLAQDGNDFFVHHHRYGQLTLQLKDRFPAVDKTQEKGGYSAPMPSEVLSIAVEVGQEVAEGTPLITLLSMKMENTIVAHETGVVKEIFVEAGGSIPKGTLLLSIDPIES